MRVLIIEDDPHISANLLDFLEAGGNTVDTAGDGITGLRLAVTQKWDVIVLDLGLPRLNGLAVCQRLREQERQDTPILMLTARDTLDDKLEGFRCGTDDYVVKPFSLREIEARLLALAKRHNGEVTQAILRVGDITLDTRSLQVERNGQAVKLPPTCLEILRILMQDPAKVHSRNALECAIWGDVALQSDALRTHIHVLRRALTAHGGSDPLENLHGQGYRLAHNTDTRAGHSHNAKGLTT